MSERSVPQANPLSQRIGQGNYYIDQMRIARQKPTKGSSKLYYDLGQMIDHQAIINHSPFQFHLQTPSFLSSASLPRYCQKILQDKINQRQVDKFKEEINDESEKQDICSKVNSIQGAEIHPGITCLQDQYKYRFQLVKKKYGKVQQQQVLIGLLTQYQDWLRQAQQNKDSQNVVLIQQGLKVVTKNINVRPQNQNFLQTVERVKLYISQLEERLNTLKSNPNMEFQTKDHKSLDFTKEKIKKRQSQSFILQKGNITQRGYRGDVKAESKDSIKQIQDGPKSKEYISEQISTKQRQSQILETEQELSFFNDLKREEKGNVFLSLTESKQRQEYSFLTFRQKVNRIQSDRTQLITLLQSMKNK